MLSGFPRFLYRDGDYAFFAGFGVGRGAIP
jgi:hypothetical protein